jgi:4-alpha-glucanotransferase
VLQALGAPVEAAADVPDALRERRLELWQRVCEPVLVAWDGLLPPVQVRVPARAAEVRIRRRLELEDGTDHSRDVPGEESPVAERAEVEGSAFVSRFLPPTTVPLGYHRLEVAAGPHRGAALVIAAPRRAPGGPGDRGWGVFLPLYALRTRRSWGTGDLTDLEALVEWAGSHGARAVATLPLLAGFLDELYEPSPYLPASRLFWNELYVDPERLPELERSPGARALLASAELVRERAALRRMPLADYRRSMAAKRVVLEELARALFEQGGPRLAGLRAHARDRPLLRDYARFRAVCERRRDWWGEWPERMRRGALAPSDRDDEAERYHLYVQWAAEQQMGQAAEAGRRAGATLYLDLPLAVNPAGFDVWREQDIFVQGMRGGAPPDEFFTGGQDWGFPPLHPERSREHGHHYFTLAVRHLARHASVLRIDHVMGLHRLYWIPPGLGPADGVYVRYPGDELFAALTLEAHRHGTVLVGEDLGTVPPSVRAAMARHNVHRSFVVQFEARPDPKRALPPARPGMFAGLGTHDMPTFASFWEGRDVLLRRELGLVDEAGARREERRRHGIRRALMSVLRSGGWVGPAASGEELGSARVGRAVLRGILANLAAGRARVVVVNLEDLWWETRPQNVPGTGAETPNWRRKARYGLERLRRAQDVRDTLEEVDRLRRRMPSP